MTREDLKKDILLMIEEEYGDPTISEDSPIISTGIDSFGITTFFLLLNDKYSFFKDVEGTDLFSSIDIEHITLREVIDKCLLTSTK